MDLFALMQGIEKGDSKAFAAFCDYFKLIVYEAAFSRTENAEDAKQIRKSVFKEAYTSIREKGPYPGDVKEWLLRLTDKHVRTAWHQRVQSALDQNPPPPERHQVFEPVGVKSDPAVLTKQYSNAEAKELEARADARLFSSSSDDDYDSDDEKASVFSLVALVGLTALLAWMMVGFLSSLEILPGIDLGYTWFNETIFMLF